MTGDTTVERVVSLAWQLPHATGMAKKKKRKEIRKQKPQLNRVQTGGGGTLTHHQSRDQSGEERLPLFT